jgi:inosine-uridine nucleoside N-ribohydrolase
MQFQSQARPPAGVVYDADLGNTIDDALALAALFGFQGKNQTRVLSVCTTKSSLNAAIFADVLVRFYTGPPSPFAVAMPIGLALGKGSADTPMMTAVLEKPVHARDIRQMNDTADPLAVFRNALSAQFDGNAIVYLSGPATNLAAALALPGIKPLISAKVKYLVAAVGNYAGGVPDPQVLADIPAAKRLFSEWPTPVVAVGTEMADAVTFPAASLEKDFAWSENHPLVDAYRAFQTMPYDAKGAPLAAAIYAVNPTENYFKHSNPGTIAVGDDGKVMWTAAGTGKHSYLIADPSQQATLQQLLVEVVSAKPVPRGPRFRPQQKKKQ